MSAAQRRPKLDPWDPGKVKREAIAHASLLLAAWFGGLGHLGLAMLLTAEIVVVGALSAFVYPQRGLGRHLADTLSLGGVAGFLLAFVLLLSAPVLGPEGSDGLEVATTAILDITPGVLAWGVAGSAAHLVAMLVQARQAREPRAAWVDLALVNASVTLIWLFLLIPASLLLGPPLRLLTTVNPNAGADGAFVLLSVGLRFAVALFMSRMPAEERAAVAANPYMR